MAERLILVGRVAGAFGVKGEVRITTYTEDPMALVRYRVLLREDGGTALTLTGARPVKGGIAARAEEVETREAAEALRGLRLHVPRAALPPPEDEDEFYLADLIGLSAETVEGEPLGRIKSVQNFGAGDLLEIQPPQGASWWLPFTREAVPEVRLADRKIIAIRPEDTE
jgi:16S rRNA processing protein RimM